MRNQGIIILKFLATILITYSHMDMLFPKYSFLATGGMIGDCLFFFCSGFTLFMGRHDSFLNWYKRRLNRIYPTVIVWAILSTFIFKWSWSVIDILMPSKYWFITSILVYYVIIYVIRQFFKDKLNNVFVFCCFVTLLSSFYLLDFSKVLITTNYHFRNIFCFLFMLLGAMQASKDACKQTITQKAIYLLLSVASYYGCLALLKINPSFCKFQIISIIPLLYTVHWLYKLTIDRQITKVLQSRLGRVISIISSLTLEIYMVQYALLTDKFNHLFPLNIVVTFMLCFVLAYILRCLSNVFTQIFNDNPLDLKKVYKI